MTTALDRLRAGIETATSAATAPAAALEPVAEYLPDYRPTVMLKKLDLRSVLRIGIAAMAAATRGGRPFVYRKLTRSGAPVALVTVDPEGNARFWPDADAHRLAYAVLQPVESERFDPVTGALIATYATTFPRDVASALYQAALHDPGIPAVRIISTAPVVLDDGRVASTPGYNSDEEVLITIPTRDLEQWEQYRVPASPTRDEAQLALDFIDSELLHDFPWDGTHDRATMLAYLLTAATRYLYGTAPAFAFDAPERGTGKSLCASLGRVIAQGHSGYQSLGYRKGQDAEIWKQLAAMALAGEQFGHVDELPRDDRITSTALSEVVTAPMVKTRLLSTNSEVVIEGVMFTFAGNNLQLGLDFTRRVLKARLRYVGAGSAYRRAGFRHSNVGAWAGAHRPQLLAALHTIVVHGLQQNVTPAASLGSYEDWSRVVIGALSAVFLSTPEGPASVGELTLDHQAALGEREDDLAEDWGDFLSYWHRLWPGEEWVPMAQVHLKVVHAQVRPDLPEVLIPTAGQSAVGAARAWSRHVRTVRETPMMHSGDRFTVYTRRDRNTALFRVLKT